MTDSNRELILEAFKTTMGKITELNGFNNTVTKVVRKMLSYDDPALTFPVLMVLGGGEVYEDELGDSSLSRFKIKIRGYTKNEADPEGTMNGLIRDVMVVLENKTYNTYHKSYRPISLDCDEGWLSTELNGLALFEFIFEILYRFTRSSP